MGDDLFRERDFCDEYVTHVFCKNVDVERNNLLKLPTLGNPIAKVRAKNLGCASGMKDSDLRMLSNELYLCEGARVMLICNISTDLGLCNGSLGIVKDICYGADDVNRQVPNVPVIVWVEFDEGTYTGSHF